MSRQDGRSERFALSAAQEVESITTIDGHDPAAHVRVLGIDDVLELATTTPSAARRALGFDD